MLKGGSISQRFRAQEVIHVVVIGALGLATVVPGQLVL